MNKPRNYRWVLVVQLYLVTALWGAVQVGGESFVMRWLVTGFQASAVSLWVVLDAGAAGRPMVRIVQELHVFFWWLTAPIYLRSRGFGRGFSLAFAHVIGVVCVNLAGFYATLYAVYGSDAFMSSRF